MGRPNHGDFACARVTADDIVSGPAARLPAQSARNLTSEYGGSGRSALTWLSLICPAAGSTLGGRAGSVTMAAVGNWLSIPSGVHTPFSPRRKFPAAPGRLMAVPQLRPRW